MTGLEKLDKKKKLLLGHIRGSKTTEISLNDLSEVTNISILELSKLLEELKDEGYPLAQNQREGELYLNYSKAEDLKLNEINIETKDNEPFKALVISDLRMGSIYEQPTILQELIQISYKEGYRNVIICGNLFEGLYPATGNTKKSEYYNSLFLKDRQAQLSHFINMYPYLEGMKTYFITGEKDKTLTKRFEKPVGLILEGIRDDMYFLGNKNGRLKINDVDILVKSDSAKKTYTTSYRLEQFINSLRSEDKPDIVLNGGLLQMEHLPNYREIEGFSVPSLVATTQEMTDKSWSNTVGAWQLELSFKKDGSLDKLQSYRVPYFKTHKDDYLTAKPLKGTSDVINRQAAPKMEKTDLQKEIQGYYSKIRSHMSIDDIAKTLSKSTEEVKGLLNIFKMYGLKVSTYKLEDGKTFVQKSSKMPKKEKKLSKEDLYLSSFLVMGDLHLGGKVQQPRLVRRVIDEAQERGITRGFLLGDLVQGDYVKIRPEEQYALIDRGFDEQYYNLNKTIDKRDNFLWFMSAGSHDETHKKNGGASLGYHLARERDDIMYLGQDIITFGINGEKVYVNPKVKELNYMERENLEESIKNGYCYDFNSKSKDRKAAVVVTGNHPGGGSAKSRSYKLQSQIENLESNTKPKILIDAHYHKPYDFLYRNVFGAQVGCMTDSGQFSVKNNLSNIISSTFINAYHNENGEIEYISFDYMNFGKDDVILNDWGTEYGITNGKAKILSKRVKK